VRGFQAGETKRLCARVAAGTTVVSDGGQWFRCIAEQPGIVHERHVTGSDRAVARHPAFRWANTMLANIKNSLLATHRVVGAKHLPRYLGAFAWRFNRRFVLKSIHERLAIAATTTPPMPYPLLKLAEARWSAGFWLPGPVPNIEVTEIQTANMTSSPVVLFMGGNLGSTLDRSQHRSVNTATMCAYEIPAAKLFQTSF